MDALASVFTQACAKLYKKTSSRRRRNAKTFRAYERNCRRNPEESETLPVAPKGNAKTLKNATPPPGFFTILSISEWHIYSKLL